MDSIQQEIDMRKQNAVQVLPDNLKDFASITPKETLRQQEKDNSIQIPRNKKFDNGYNTVMLDALFGHVTPKHYLALMKLNFQFRTKTN